MEDKRQILSQIGWSDELIEKCLSPNKPILGFSQMEYHILSASEQDITNLVISVDAPIISDGTKL